MTELPFSAWNCPAVEGGEDVATAATDPTARQADALDRAERRLIAQARRDPQAFAAIYRRHYAAIAAYIYRRTGDRHVAEDLTAEVFLAAVRAIGGYRSRGVPLRAWLFRIATNTVNRWVRRNRRWLRARPYDSDGSAAPEQTDDGDARQARRALLTLSSKLQSVLALHYLEGLSVEEVASVLGCRTGTVKSRLSRAREALRSRLTQGR